VQNSIKCLFFQLKCNKGIKQIVKYLEIIRSPFRIEDVDEGAGEDADEGESEGEDADEDKVVGLGVRAPQVVQNGPYTIVNG
jgi:hypothetical protein